MNLSLLFYFWNIGWSKTAPKIFGDFDDIFFGSNCDPVKVKVSPVTS